MASLALAQPSDTGTAAAEEEETGEVVRLSPFTVTAEQDYGYRAANTISGTRTNTPIREVPLNIQVFTDELFSDLVVTNQVDMEAYNASLVNGGADLWSNNPIQQAYNNFLFRGFVQNWGMRDGIREYDPIDTQGLARIEIVKGPSAALYGLSYPGGLMNLITKTVDHQKNFSRMDFTVEDQGGYRTALDANYSGKVSGTRFGIRFNGAYSATEDDREHSKGSIQYSQIQTSWMPTETTDIRLLIERGYREKPNGLSYFTRGAGNSGVVPLQIDHPEIPWTWNWSNGDNMRSTRTSLYRFSVNQSIGENIDFTAYYQYSTRKNIDGDGWDASGSGGGDSWEAGGGWIDPNGPDERIEAGYSYRDWSNNMHAYGATAVYKLNFEGMKNTFTFGGAAWSEKFVSRLYKQSRPVGLPSEVEWAPIHISFPVEAGISTQVPYGPPSDLRAVPETDQGFAHENSSNDYYYAAWQASFLDDRLTTNVAINRTNLKLVRWDLGITEDPSNITRAKETSPLYGVIFDITDEISVFALSGTSLFPTTDKSSVGVQMPPVTGESLEGGFKFSFMEDKLSGTVSYYKITQEGGAQRQANIENRNTALWDSMTEAQRAATWPGRTRADLLAEGDLVPGAQQESKGYELDVNYQPTRSLAFQASYAHCSQEVVEVAPGNESALGQSTIGLIKDRWSLLGRYTVAEGASKGLYVGAGLVYDGKALQDYIGGVARYNPSRTWAELFAGYRFKLFEKDTAVQLNIKNLTKVPEFVGWVPNGELLATERYEVDTPIRYSLTFSVDL